MVKTTSQLRPPSLIASRHIAGWTMLAIGLITLSPLLTVSVTTKSWQHKDWRQWTFNDCFHILSASPWGKRGGGTGPFDEYTNRAGPDPGATVFIVSAHVVRQALVRQMELSELYRKLDPDARAKADQKAEACLGQTFNDQIVVHVDAGSIDGIHLFQSNGKEVRRVQLAAPVDSVSGSSSVTRQCIGELGNFYLSGHDVAFPRSVEGNPIISPGDEKFRIEIDERPVLDFNFRIDRMTYQGKADY